MSLSLKFLKEKMARMVVVGQGVLNGKRKPKGNMKQIEEVDSLRKEILTVIEKHFHACEHRRFLKSFKLTIDRKTDEIKSCELYWHFPKTKQTVN